MKFDHIIMNPPYCRNLHLKILSESVKHSDDVVCIHPARWLEDALWYSKSNSERKRFSHLVSRIGYVSLLDGHCFGNDISPHSDIAIIKYVSNSDYEINKYSIKFTDFTERLFLTIKSQCEYIKDHLDSSKAFKLNLPRIHGHIDNDDFYEITSKNYKVALCVKPNKYILSFDTEDERKNFHSSTLLNVYKFWNEFTKIGIDANVNAPWLGDYTHQWTDEDCCKRFNLDNEQTNFICNTLNTHSIKEFINYVRYK